MPDEPLTISRRQFLADSAGLAVAAMLGSSVAARDLRGGVGDEPLASAGRRAIVAKIRAESVIQNGTVRASVLADMLTACLSKATGRPDAPSAWRALLKADDIIGLKFNRSGAAELGITAPLARELVRSLGQAGFPAQQIVLIEAPPGLADDLQTLPGIEGWTTPVDFGSGRDELAAVVRQITAFVNVAFLKSHNIAGITACMKNMSHGLVKHPARYHSNHCSPYVADIYALPDVGGKVKLNIVNALRIVYDGGPGVRPSTTWDAGLLLAGTDAVATDRIALELINDSRQTLLLPPIVHREESVEYLLAAAERRIGVHDRHDIDIIEAAF